MNGIWLGGIDIAIKKSLSELHVPTPHGRIVSALDAFNLLMDKIPPLNPITWRIGLPLILLMFSQAESFTGYAK